MKSQAMGIKMPLKYLKANVKIVLKPLWKREKITMSMRNVEEHHSNRNGKVKQAMVSLSSS